MGDIHCTDIYTFMGGDSRNHRMGLHLAKILWNHICNLNGLVPKCITFLAQTGQEQSCCPTGKFIIPNHLISQEQDRVQISEQMQMYSIPRTGLCLTSGLMLTLLFPDEASFQQLNKPWLISCCCGNWLHIHMPGENVFSPCDNPKSGKVIYK